MYKNVLLNFFEQDFLTILLEMDDEYQYDVLKQSSYLFRKWYYSSLTDYEGYSPSMLLNKKCYRSDILALGISFHINKEDKDKPVFDIGFQDITKEKHPFVDDLRTLLEYFDPDIIVDNEYRIAEEERNEIYKDISKEEDFYIDYLMLIAKELDLIEEIPSLFVKRMALTDKCEAFFAQEYSVIFETIFKTALDVSTRELFTELNIESRIEEAHGLLYSYLQEHATIEDLLKSLSSYLDDDMEEFFDAMEQNELTEQHNEKLSDVYRIGLLLDKWFFIPFGSYLYMVEPLYASKYRLMIDMNNIYSRLSLDRDTTPAHFHVYTCYSLTRFGKEFVRFSGSVISMQDMASTFIFDHFIANYAYERQQERSEWLKRPRQKVYKLKIYNKLNPEKWAILEIIEERYLDVLILFINMLFNKEHKRAKMCKVGNTQYLDLKIPVSEVIKPGEFIISFKNPAGRKEDYVIENLDTLEQKLHIVYPRVTDLSFSVEEDFDV